MTEQSRASSQPMQRQPPRREPTSAYRKLRRKLSLTKLRIPQIWLRHWGLRPADVFSASYPRSGVTWLRFTLFEILTGRASGFQAVNAEMSLRIFNRHNGLITLPGNGRLFGTHEPYRKEYKRAIYLARHVGDVILSEFAYTRALGFFRGDLDEFLTVFLRKKINPFGPWQRHVDSWLDSPIAGTRDFLLVHYEDIRQDPLPGFTRIVEFLGVDAGRDRIQRAIANNALEQMKEKERAEPQRVSAKDRFVRNGSVHGWRSKLSPEQVHLIEQYAGSALVRLGYPLASSSGADRQCVADTALGTPPGVFSPLDR
jgi:hypothetical protein